MAPRKCENCGQETTARKRTAYGRTMLVCSDTCRDAHAETLGVLKPCPRCLRLCRHLLGPCFDCAREAARWRSCANGCGKAILRQLGYENCPPCQLVIGICKANGVNRLAEISRLRDRQQYAMAEVARAVRECFPDRAEEVLAASVWAPAYEEEYED